MAYYQNLPIYRKTFELILYIEAIVRNFPRYHKYAIGAEMRSLSKNIAVLIIKANSQRDKVGLLTELRDKCEEMKLLITIGKEIKAFRDFGQFQHAAGMAVEISRQSEGWLGSQRNKGPESPRG